MSQEDRHTGAEIRTLLTERFPLCFMPKGAAKHPLKVGIKRDIERRCTDLTRRQIFLALADYCGGPTYQRALAERRDRVDLDGKVTYPGVSEQQAAFARECLKRLLPGEALAEFVAPEPCLYMGKE